MTFPYQPAKHQRPGYAYYLPWGSSGEQGHDATYPNQVPIMLPKDPVQPYLTVDNRLYGTHYSNTGSIPPGRSSRRSTWLLVGGGVAVLIILALAVAIPLSLSGMYKETTDPEGDVSGTSSPAAPRQMTVGGEIRITNMDYSPDLDDPGSTMFKQYSDTVCGQILDGLQVIIENPLCEVIKFWNGSLQAQYTVTAPVNDDLQDADVQDLELQVGQAIFTSVTGESSVLAVAEDDINIDADPIDHCVPNPCPVNSECRNIPFDYRCDCNDGYKKSKDGSSCEDIDDCANEPCTNGGTCIDAVGDYTCQCADGYTGDKCQEDVDECELGVDQCSDSCENTDGGYRCTCPRGEVIDADGFTCVDKDECATLPCQNEGMCINGEDSFTCLCVGVYKGPICTDRTYCSYTTCLNGGVCVELENSGVCDCQPGFEGKTCAKNIDDCANDPCVHGDCIDGVDSYICVCQAGYEGTQCDQDIDDCDNNPCMNEGVCLDWVDSFTCQCIGTFSGPTCGEMDACRSDPCKNNGLCHTLTNGFRCTCAEGFMGDTCDDIDYCFVDPCINGACTVGEASYVCTCDPGFTGARCHIDVNDCENKPCVNGICIDGTDAFTCDCNEGYFGDLCERDVDHCDGDPCGENGDCSNTGISFLCSCHAGYDGRTCTLDIDECGTDVHDCSQLCENKQGSYVCACQAGFLLEADGTTCTAVAVCMDDTCDHGECTETDGVIDCRCDDGYAGGRCDMDINECDDGTAVCQHVCANVPGNYSCECAAGYVLGQDGYSCYDINDCDDETTCEQICTNEEGTYQCSCNPGYTLDMDRSSCNDIDECGTDVHDCSQLCENTQGSYVCACQAGFLLEADDTTCTAVSSCARDTCVHGDCVEAATGVRCICEDGYTGDRCQNDINECTSEGGHACAQVCLNTDGSYSCGCEAGYSIAPNRRACNDIDECVTRKPCSQLCTNTPGGFICGCLDGFILDPNGTTCNEMSALIYPMQPEISVWEGEDMDADCIAVTDVDSSVIEWLDPSDEVIQTDLDRIFLFPLPDRNGRHALRLRIKEVREEDTGTYTCRVSHGAMESTDNMTLTVRPPVSCAPDEERCLDDRECYKWYYTCDGYPDCEDGSDEQNCACMTTDGRQFICRDKSQCIPGYYMCDSRQHCRDGSDEEDCDDVGRCNEREFECRSPEVGQCVPHFLRCDGSRDCSDGSDEYRCNNTDGDGNSTAACEQGFFPCTGAGANMEAGMCHPVDKWCDGRQDCEDGSDEIDDCFNECPMSYDKCGSGGCYSADARCDGIKHCDDWTDEVDCECTDTEFKCTEPRICRAEYLWCDGYVDCPDASDEPDFCLVCPPHKLECTGKCIARSQICDKLLDCPQPPWLDEQDCECEDTELQCAMGMCINATNWCDGMSHCPDDSDEMPNCTCNEFQFTCPERCLRLEYVCNTREDCIDGTDESDCPCTNGTTVTDPHGEITSIFYPQTYPDYLDCVWWFVAAAGQRIRFTFVDVHVYGSDTIRLFDGPSSSSAILIEGYTDFSFNYTSTGQDATMTFTGGYKYSSYRGFKISYAMQAYFEDDFRCMNGRFITNTTTLLCDLRNDCGDWTDEVNCECTAFNMDYFEHYKDYDHYTDTNDTQAIVSYKHMCEFVDYDRFDHGATPAGATGEAQTACIHLSQYCDGTPDCPAGVDEPDGCASMDPCNGAGVVLTNTEGSIVSAGYNEYGSLFWHRIVTCSWTLSGQYGMRILLDLHEVRINSRTTLLTVHDGPDASSRLLFTASYRQNTELNEREIRSSGPALHINLTYHAFDLLRGAGFNSSYRMLESEGCFDDEFDCGGNVCIPEHLRCDFTVDCANHVDELNCDCERIYSDHDDVDDPEYEPEPNPYDYYPNDYDWTTPGHPTPWPVQYVYTCWYTDPTGEEVSMCIPRTGFCDGHEDCIGGVDEHDGCVSFPDPCAEGGNGVTLDEDSNVIRSPGYIDGGGGRYGVHQCLWKLTGVEGARVKIRVNALSLNPGDFVRVDEYCRGKVPATIALLTSATNWTAVDICSQSNTVRIAFSSNASTSMSNGFELEYSIENVTGCFDDETQCANGRCIPALHRCDGQPHCADHSDEIGCDCQDIAERKGWMVDGVFDWHECIVAEVDGDTRTCIPQSKLCDQIIDCRDGVDEPATCPSGADYGCEESEFACSNGRCIALVNVCNDFDDCNDASDERNCAASCGQNNFACENGNCVSTSTVCDGRNDCQDFSDEGDCPDRSCSGGTQYLLGESGTITSPWWPGNYPNDANCHWTIVAGESQSVRLTVESFHTENGYDYLHIYDGASTSNPPIMTLDGNWLNKTVIKSSSNLMHLYFESDLSEARSGFELHYEPACAVSCGAICVSARNVCDGINDCGNWMDEHNCDCNARSGLLPCPAPGNGSVDTGSCFRVTSFCDNVVDCPGATDEYPGCVNDCDTASQFQCDEKCIPNDKHCDGTVDCMGREDECDCVCMSTDYACRDGTCLPRDRGIRCDGVADCPDMSDEFNCFECGFFSDASTSTWVPSDGSTSTWVPSDESTSTWVPSDGNTSTWVPRDGNTTPWVPRNGTTTSTTPPRTSTTPWPTDRSTSFAPPDPQHWVQCHITVEREDGSGLMENVTVCVPPYKLCDGVADCPNGEDEPEVCLCPSGYFQCTNERCVDSYKRCNGVADCSDYSDERGCPSQCYGFLCERSGVCLENYERCNGYTHCPHNEDEIGCDECYFDDQFQCAMGLCLQNAVRCNSIADCPDASDEWDCGSCSEEYFQCRDYTCIPLDQRCNGEFNCDDSSDEQHCVRQLSSIPGTDHPIFIPYANVLLLTMGNDRQPPYGVFCGDGWDVEMAAQACQVLHQGSLLDWGTFPVTLEMSQFIESYMVSSPNNANAFLANFDVFQSCASSNAVYVVCEQYNCGHRILSPPPQPYIVNGHLAWSGQWPWQLSMQTSGSHFCGASLINERWALTAAHCVVENNVGSYYLMGGTLFSSSFYGDGVRMDVEMHFIHPHYDSGPTNNDVALIKFTQPVEFSPTLQPVCLSDDTFNLQTDAVECFISGWGDQGQGDTPIVQRYTMMRTIDAAVCAANSSYDVYNSTMICMGHLNGQITACYGDSGGPFVCRDDQDQWRLAGVSSWGLFCRGYTVYARVSAFLDTFINPTIDTYG